MTSGKIASWLVKEGDKVKMDQAIASIETDKATLDFQNTEDGYIAKILKPADSSDAGDIPVNTPVCIIVEDAKDVAAFKDYKVDGAAAPAPAPAAAPKEAPKEAAKEAPKEKAAPAAAKAAPAAAPTDGRVVASPLARKTATEQGVSLSGIAGTGPGGRIIAADVAEAKSSGPAAAVSAPAAGPAGAAYIDIPNNNVRKVIARRLTESKQTVPHYYLNLDVNVSRLLEVRKQLNDSAKDGAYKLSVNDFMVKACALALLKVPTVNSSWHGEFIRQYRSADISVAVDTGNGLITPIVFGAEKRGLVSISSSVKELAKKAKEGKLRPEEFQGGTFSISNMGMYGINSFTSIINTPQSAILAIGAASDRVVPAENERGFEVVPVVTVTLSCDHRVIDGATGAQWLQAFKGFVENPLTLLL